MDTLLLESRSKLKEISKSKQSNKKQAEVYDSLGAVEELLSSMSSITSFDDDEEQNEKVWERNRRKFPDNKDIDPYDPTTYGYTELGKCLSFVMPKQLCLLQYYLSNHAQTIIIRNHHWSAWSSRSIKNLMRD